MDKFTVITQRDGFAVASRHTYTGQLVAVSDHSTRDSADRQAAKLNALHEQVQAGCIPGRRIPARVFESAAA